jgi:hypothetical protein
MAGAIGAGFLAALREQRGVRAQVWAQVGAQVWAQVGDQVWAQVRDQVWAQVGAQVGDQVRAQVWAQVRDQVGAQVGDQVGAQVWDQVGAQVYRAGYGQHDASWLGWLDAFTQFGLADIVAPAAGLTRIAESSGWWWPFAGAIIFTDRPARLRRDERGRLHSDDGAAIQYPDGWGIYAWHGVRVAEAVILRPEQLTIEQIRNEPNAEVRRVMLERFGFDRYLSASGAIPVHADECGTLYRCEIPGDEPLTLVSVLNSTPEPDGSTKTYHLRVPPGMQTAREAIAWTFGLPAEKYRPVVET